MSLVTKILIFNIIKKRLIFIESHKVMIPNNTLKFHNTNLTTFDIYSFNMDIIQ